ncbi:EAL domain-containing protein [Bacillus salacetis]|uniref:EAL domain-containing protein n=1 Tax=Bacillus salacetis TaxID=2315464 RepID=A0A3A1R4G0_9BACI|nr:EAL domain-containing protein [Bacillus salacetis]RIW35302.1 EAL domain-containing protein [Bacillus salacetis]
MAKSFNHTYHSKEELYRYISSSQIDLYPSILVQMFLGQLSMAEAKRLRSEVLSKLPGAVIIGCSTEGQVADGRIINQSPVLSFTVLEETEVVSTLFEAGEVQDGFQRGRQLAEELVNMETKAVILFASHLDMNPQEVLEGFHAVTPQIPVGGGVSIVTAGKKQSIVLTENSESENGIAAAALNNSNLHVHTFINEQWKEVGRPLTVTKSKGAIIEKIDHQKPLKVLKHYLGERFVAHLPESGVEFPFLVKRKDSTSTLFPTRIHSNGSIEMSKQVKQGESLTFAFADLEAIVDCSLKELNRLRKKPVESMFIFNCVARRQFITDFSESEMQMMGEVSSLSGFFSHGEILMDNDNPPELYSHSLTCLAISERGHLPPLERERFQYILTPEGNTRVSLTQLINASSYDIEKLNQNIQISEEYYRSLFDNNTDFVYSTDLKGRFNSINPTFLKTFGYTEEELIGKLSISYIFEEDVPRIKRHFYRTLSGKEQFYDLWIPSKSGEVQLFHIKNIPITIEGKCVGLFGIGRNITEQKKTEERITQLAYFDSETGLPNRVKFREIAEEFIERARKKRRRLGILFLDIDRFKLVNDTLGHSAGDRILIELAERIKNVLPKGAYLGRFGSDKFTILISKNVTDEKIKQVAEMIAEHIQIPVMQGNQEFYIKASIGVGVYPDHGTDLSDLLRNADTALNWAKSNGGDQIIFYTDEMNIKAMEKVKMESYLRKALERNELGIVYQPIVELSGRRVIGAEALLRWNHPYLGAVSPMEFIPLAEETGLIGQIGSWVLMEACKQANKWQEKGFPDFYISVNVSANQFQQPSFTHEINHALKVSGLSPENLCLELTESVMIQHSGHTIDRMEELSALGVKIAIDDFGTGYSSLGYLKDLPLHVLKIDKSFVQNIEESSPDYAIVQAVSTMGKGLGMQVVVEGIETSEQLELLDALNCDLGQGYLISRPVSPEEMEMWMIDSQAVMTKG